MTSQEARQKVNTCENQITSTYSNLCSAARNVGASASQAASSEMTKSTLFPLIISVLGLILCLALHLVVLGVVLIIVGIFIAYNSNELAAPVQKKVETQVGYLNQTLNANSKI